MQQLDRDFVCAEPGLSGITTVDCGIGNLQKLMLADGSFLTYTYDNAQRLTAITDSLGNSVTDLSRLFVASQAVSPACISSASCRA